ncbi:hypothetical protein [Burkholderia thailandensis]|uniref:hypothetical protein n=1 Tax=Burkholderia thailandensis TaxID=57975 RepID=UPI0023B15346|nr:hypothetical protein [Burkholderia thailandensis]
MSITIEMLDSFPGSYMPETKWLLYAENAPAPLCRKPGGSYMAEDDMGLFLFVCVLFTLPRNLFSCSGCRNRSPRRSSSRFRVFL